MKRIVSNQGFEILVDFLFSSLYFGKHRICLALQFAASLRGGFKT